jgi:uncharacterized protein YbcI
MPQENIEVLQGPGAPTTMRGLRPRKVEKRQSLRPIVLSQMPSEDVQSESARSGPARTLTRRMVQLHKEFYGRGPTKAKAYLQDDSIVVLMRGGFTPVEETLLQAGRGESVARQRRDFQEVMRHRFTAMVEEVTGQTVVAFMNSSHQDPDLLCNVFLLKNTDLLEP